MKSVLLAFIVISIIAVFFYQQPKVVNPMAKKSLDSPNIEKTHNHEVHSLTSHAIKKDDKELSTGQVLDQSDVSHLDQISPEMKEKIRNKLLFHAPIETIQKDDGLVLMNPNGRFTQMPVAVQMPDGSIVVKEYSYIPEGEK
ncbi:MAG: hypothetical protein ACJA1X_001338 [Bermanella sp.]